ncbi:ferrous iron transport protein B [Anaerosinus massiliensis]|uniref:ferrous iron transport protein B n=1 Tax=Massilibacillus massiliensis TaxID=1806837 RepID=UPI000AEE42F5|nr:ferrous iron transport protein B [Massilibacillus massiliensis]
MFENRIQHLAFLKERFHIQATPQQFIIALAGNPNVGKSTIFNELTGLRQHTGNWPGKTVDNAQGTFHYFEQEFLLIDLPGTYSIMAHSMEEEIARDFICEAKPDATLIVVDASSLERNLNLALQVMNITSKVVVCVNLLDEAKRKGIDVNLNRLSEQLGVPVVGTTARTGEGMEDLKRTLFEVANNEINSTPRKVQMDSADPSEDEIVATLYQHAEQISQQVVQKKAAEKKSLEHRLDDLLTSRWFGYPVMLLLLSCVFWITIEGSNIPSQLLADLLLGMQDDLSELFIYLGAPAWLHGIVVSGMYRSLAWVVSVMLPPMAIFFPLFTLLEDLGYLPRVAFNLDHAFKKCHSCGKQILTMCMGFGCNAAGIVSCRIIDSPRERLIAIVTNNLVPCNGRFPTLIAISTIFVAGIFAPDLSTMITSLSITLIVLLGILLTFFSAWALSHTLLKGEPSTNILELPPYRMPKFTAVLYRSLIDRTIFVLKRAVIMAAPAGAITWILANTMVGDSSLLQHFSQLLNPIAYYLGLDGVILMAFILGLPANEIVVPIILMSYLATGQLTEVETLSQLKDILLANGWTWLTAVNTMLFCLLHWPCTTALLSAYKESGSVKWTAVAFLLPTILGIIVCIATAFTARALGLV